jgi:hypothetical protein
MTSQIHSTLNYESFKTFPFNRDVCSKHVAKLKESIDTLGLTHPIIVNEKRFIIDGQHRLQAVKELGLPVQFIVNDSMSAKDLIEINTTQRRWSMEDYLHYYCERKNVAYLRCHDFIHRFPGMTLLAAKNLLTNQSNNILHLWKIGLFKVTHMDQAIDQASFLWYYADEFDKPFVKGTRFIQAFQKIYNKLKPDDRVHLLREAMLNNSRRVVKCSSRQESYEMLVEIYNYRRRKGTIKINE